MMRPRVLLLVLVLAIVFGVNSAIASGPIHTIALSGQAAPGTDSGVVFDGFLRGHYSSFTISRLALSNIDLNNNGHVAFQAYLAGDEIDTNASGIWREFGGDLSLVAQTSDAAPGVAERTFNEFAPMTLHDNGDVAVVGYLTERQYCPRGVPCEPREYGVWTQQPGGPLSLAVTLGTTLIDADTTMAFNSVLGVSTSQRAQGLQILVGGVSGIRGETNYEYGIWSVASLGTQRLLAQRGDPAPGMPDGFTLGLIGRPQLDAQGQLGFVGTASESGGMDPRYSEYGVAVPTANYRWWPPPVNRHRDRWGTIKSSRALTGLSLANQA